MLSARNSEIQRLYETFDSFYPGDKDRERERERESDSGRKPKHSFDNRDAYEFRTTEFTPKTDSSSDVNRYDKKV
jgi:hypothetical protein